MLQGSIGEILKRRTLGGTTAPSGSVEDAIVVDRTLRRAHFVRALGVDAIAILVGSALGTSRLD